MLQREMLHARTTSDHHEAHTMDNPKQTKPEEVVDALKSLIRKLETNNNPKPKDGDKKQILVKIRK